MDLYHSIHGHDVSTFDIQDTHRLPAVSAAQALDDLDDDPSRCVSTGLRDLDGALAAGDETGDGPRDGERDGTAGVSRGQVTEIWGPPGAGKTAMGIQLCASALSDGHGAVWVDCAYPTSGHRLRTVVDAVCSDRQSETSPKPSQNPEKPSEEPSKEPTAEEPSEEPTGEPSEKPDTDTEAKISSHDPKEETKNAEPEDQKFVHYRCHTLAHFIALLCRPVASSLPSSTAVVVIDSLPTLLNEAFPKTQDMRRDLKTKKGSGLSTRRLQTLQYVIGALQKLAATRNCAVVLLSQCATRMQPHGLGASLTPSINASVWEQGVAARLVLFRDWVWEGGRAASSHFAGVQRIAGRKVEGLEKVFAFRVEETGLVPVEYDGAKQSEAGTSVKRKLGDAGLEIPDSEDDDYGWDPDDEAHLPPEPPQWQGSEDLIVGTQRSDDEGVEEGDVDEESTDGEGVFDKGAVAQGVDKEEIGGGAEGPAGETASL